MVPRRPAEGGSAAPAASQARAFLAVLGQPKHQPALGARAAILAEEPFPAIEVEERPRQVGGIFAAVAVVEDHLAAVAIFQPAPALAIEHDVAVTARQARQ